MFVRVYSSLVKLSLALHKKTSNDLWKFLLGNFYNSLIHYVQNNFLAWYLYVLFAKKSLNLSIYFSRNIICQNFFLRGLRLKFQEWYSLLKTVKGISSTKETKISPRVCLYSDCIVLIVWFLYDLKLALKFFE